jgi:hypothetical protein
MSAPRLVSFEEYRSRVPKFFKDGCEVEFECDGCGKHKDALVQVGEEEDYDSATCRLCAACLKKALALFQNKEKVS